MQDFVKDSDDEDDLGSQESPPCISEPLLESENASGVTATESGSTGELRRAIHDAHDALFRATRSNIRQADDEASQPLALGSTTVSAIRHEQSSLLSHGDDDAPREPITSQANQNSTGSRQDPKRFLKEGLHSGDASGHEQRLQNDAAAAWTMPATLQRDFMDHDPAALFPSISESILSSTIPDNTVTQQRLFDEYVRANAQALDPRDQPLRLDSTGSLRSSIFRTTQATKSPPCTKNADSQADSRKNTNMTSPQAVSGSHGTPCEPLRSQPQSTSTHSAHIEMATADELPISSSQLRSKHERSEATWSGLGEISRSLGREKPKSQRSIQDARKRPSPDSLEEDELTAIGLPKEQYKPRPSRSRSAQGLSLDQIDFSVNPDRIARERAKRRKTVTCVGALEALEDPFLTPSSKAKGGVVTSIQSSSARSKSAVKTDTRNGEDTLNVSAMPGSSRPKRRDLDDPAMALNAEVSHAREEREVESLPNLPATKEPSAPKVLVSVLVPPPMPEDGRTEIVRHDIVLPEAEEDPRSATTDEDEPPVPSRRRRGRPKKHSPHDAIQDALTSADSAQASSTHEIARSATNVAANDSQQPCDPKTSLEDEETAYSEKEVTKTAGIAGEAPPEPSDRIRHQPLSEVDKNAGRKPRAPGKGDRSLKAKHNEEAPESVHVATTASFPSEPNTPKQEKTTSAQHSPLSKSKVPYRVGLSRHARIPSLLKVMKK